MKFAIRDDDTSFFTKPEELEKAYDFVQNGPVSLSVVPYTVPIHRDDVFPYGRENAALPHVSYPLSENTVLVDYLREAVKTGKYDILLHGYSHEYRKVNGQWTAEMKWKDADRLRHELPSGKHLLEELFSTEVKVFVAPNNSIDQNAISVISEMGMDYSGIIQLGDRRITPLYLLNFCRRWAVRAIQKIPYPGVLDYGDHKELVAYTLDSAERLKKEYRSCKRKNAPFVVYTHYWQVNSDPAIKRSLMDIYDYAMRDGAELVRLTDCFGGST